MNDPILTPEQIAHNQRPLTKKEILILDLEDAQEYIKRGWTQKASARDKNGINTIPWEKDATSWCIIGACSAAHGNYLNDNYMLDQIRDALKIACISSLNDTELKTKEEAAAVFDKTIEYVKTRLDDNLNTLI